jgi:hypothetical protein
MSQAWPEARNANLHVRCIVVCELMRKAELCRRPLDAEERLKNSMRSHFAKERATYAPCIMCYVPCAMCRGAWEGGREGVARAIWQEQLLSDSFVLNWDVPRCLA